MATKTSEKKSAGTKKPAATPAGEDQTTLLAEEVLGTLLHRALVRLGEPARPNEIARETGEEAITPALARYAMEQRPRRFVPIDRRWDLKSHYPDKNQHRPTERTLEELIGNYGAPMAANEAAGELAPIYGRPREALLDAATRLLRGNTRTTRFFPVANGTAFGLRSWLLDTSEEVKSDLLFYNFLKAESVAAFSKIAVGMDWANNPSGAAQQIVAAGGGLPVDNRLIQYLAYEALGDDLFDAAEFYAVLFADTDHLVCLADHRWLLTQSLEPLRAVWRAQAEVAAQAVPEEPVSTLAVAAPAKPLEVTDEDLEALRKAFGDSDELQSVPDLLMHVLDIPATTPTFADDMETLTDYLRGRSEEFLWVGTNRFRPLDTLPPYIGQVPDSLTYPTLPRFETADGEILDQTLTDEGFEDDLREEVLRPLAQDVNDQELSETTLWPEGISAQSGSLSFVLKSHHKEIGTFPLAQIPYGFFPTEPNIVELTLRDSAGNSYPVYADYDVQLLYGLFDVYGDIAAESGAVFTLTKTDDPAIYLFAQENETDSNLFVSTNRMEELLELRGEVEAGPVSTYDIVRRILDHYRKGCSFLTLLTELNLVRRTPRRLLASILSGYHAFHPRANRWTFDPKREPEGFDRSKAPFLVK